MPLVVERLHDLPPDGIGDLVTDSERYGLRFVRKLADDWVSRENRFDRPGEALFGAWVDGRLVGVCGLNLDPYAGDHRVGRVRHLYVLAASRRLGVGRVLVAHVMDAARRSFDVLRLRTNNPDAARLYEAMGFSQCVEPGDASHVVDLASAPPGRPVGG